MATKKLESLAMALDIRKFKNLCRSFTPEIAVMVRGRHGIGKSEVIYQVAEELRNDFYKDPANCAAMVEALKNEPSVAKKLAKSGGVWTYEMGMPVIERRLSQMTEGDIIGLPFLEKRGTEYRPVTWIINGCQFPVVLFLDELNRAIKGVEQATFQLADSKAFYGNLLHTGTRIYIAVNVGSSYNVEEFDPAAISRYAVIDLEPSVDEFVEYARGKCNPFLPEFIAANHAALEYKEELFDPNRKYQDRRAWVKLDHQLTAAGLYNTPNDLTFLHMCASMVGFHYGNLYWGHVKNNYFNISGKEIAHGWLTARDRMPKDDVLRQQKFVELSHRLGEYLKDNKIDPKEVSPHLKQFLTDCPSECCVTTWNLLSKNKENFYAIHSAISDVVIKRITGQTSNKSNDVVSSTPTADQTQGGTIVPRQRK